jgi:hypothetical protein
MNSLKQMRRRHYVTIVNKGQKLRPNQPCPCGSGKKYKKCCKKKLEEQAQTAGSNQMTIKQPTQ